MTINQNILLSLLLIFGLLIVLAGLLKPTTGNFWHPPAEIPRPTKTSLLPIIVNLSLALGLGLYMPPTLLSLFKIKQPS